MATHIRGYYLRLYELVTQSAIQALKRGIWLHSQLKRLLIRVTRTYQLRRWKLLMLLVTILRVKLRLVLIYFVLAVHVKVVL